MSRIIISNCNNFMKTAVMILALTLTSVLSMNMLAIKANSANSNTNVIFSQPQKTSNLQISNYTGSAITSQMASVFIKFINEAYHLHTNDIIQNSLGHIFKPILGFDFPENSTAGASIYTTQLGKAYVTWSKVNTKKPQWTYIIIDLPTTTTKALYTYLDGRYQMGYEFSNFQPLLGHVVQQVQTESNCKCSTDQVEFQLYRYYSEFYRWNVVCSSSKDPGAGGFRGIIYHNNYIFEQTVELAPGRCRYLVWAI